MATSESYAEQWARASDASNPDPSAMPLARYREWFLSSLKESWSASIGQPVKLLEHILPPKGYVVRGREYELFLLELADQVKAFVTCGLALHRQPGAKAGEEWAHLELVALTDEPHPAVADVLSAIAARVHGHNGGAPIKVGSRLRFGAAAGLPDEAHRFLLTMENQIWLRGGSAIYPLVVHPVGEDEYEQAGADGIFSWQAQAYSSGDLIKDSDSAPLRWLEVTLWEPERRLDPEVARALVDSEAGKAGEEEDDGVTQIDGELPDAGELTADEEAKADALLEEGRAALKAKDGATALEKLQLAMAFHMGDPDAVCDYGRALAMTGDYEGAERMFGMAILLEDKSRYRLNRAIARERLGRPEDVPEDLAVVLEAEPQREEVRWMLVKALCACDELQQAADALSELLEHNPQSAPALAERARLYAKLGDLDAAAVDFGAAVGIGDSSPHVAEVIEKTRAELEALGVEL